MNSVIEPQLQAGFELQTGTGKVTILRAHKDFWRLSHYVLHKKGSYSATGSRTDSEIHQQAEND